MKLQKAQKQNEATIALKDTKYGDCLRFAHDSLEEAFKADLFWLRIAAPETEAKGRIRLANLVNGDQRERDGDHRVIVHRGALHIEV